MELFSALLGGYLPAELTQLPGLLLVSLDSSILRQAPQLSPAGARYFGRQGRAAQVMPVRGSLVRFSIIFMSSPPGEVTF